MKTATFRGEGRSMRLASFKHLAWVGCLVAGLALAPSSQAAPVYDTAADLTGIRTDGSGATAGGDWAGATVSWEIVDQGGGSWLYTYTFDVKSSPGISHFVLDLTDDCVNPGDPNCITGVTGQLEFGEFEPGTGNSNPGLPGSIIGVKFDFGANSYSFTSNRAPVWGDFYIKGGSDSFFHNDGITLHATSESISQFIARPNSPGGGGGDIPDVPEPSTVLLMGGSLLALGYFRKKRNS